MPRNHKPSEVSKALNSGGSGARFRKPDDSYRCPKSPSGAHYWHIGVPDGVLSTGVCQYCGEARRFVNSMGAAMRAREVLR